MNCLHKTIVFFIVSSSSILYAEKEQFHEITVEIKIKCPLSEELKEFADSVPTENGSTSLDEWRYSFSNTMTRLINLVESQKIASSSLSIKIDDPLLQEIENVDK